MEGPKQFSRVLHTSCKGKGVFPQYCTDSHLAPVQSWARSKSRLSLLPCQVQCTNSTVRSRLCSPLQYHSLGTLLLKHYDRQECEPANQVHPINKCTCPTTVYMEAYIVPSLLNSAFILQTCMKMSSQRTLLLASGLNPRPCHLHVHVHLITSHHSSMQALMALRRYLHIASIKSDELEFHNFACDIVS